MRRYCLDCVIKHLGQAYVTQMESNLGYPEHIIYTIGHLAEASEECLQISKELAEEIRQYRLKVMEDSSFIIPYLNLYNKIKELIKEKGCGNCNKAKDSFLKKVEQKKELEGQNDKNKK